MSNAVEAMIEKMTQREKGVFQKGEVFIQESLSNVEGVVENLKTSQDPPQIIGKTAAQVVSQVIQSSIEGGAKPTVLVRNALMTVAVQDVIAIAVAANLMPQSAVQKIMKPAFEVAVSEYTKAAQKRKQGAEQSMPNSQNGNPPRPSSQDAAPPRPNAQNGAPPQGGLLNAGV